MTPNQAGNIVSGFGLGVALLALVNNGDWFIAGLLLVTNVARNVLFGFGCKEPRP